MEQISRDEIMDSLDRVLASEGFASSPNLKKFLSYIIEQKLDGNEAGLKAYSIAIDAFGRSEDFDSQIDPIVRVQAGRLRKELETYYQGAGANDPIRIDVPRGSYRPEFTCQNSTFGENYKGPSDALPPPIAANSDSKTGRIALTAMIFAIIIVMVGGVLRHQFFSDDLQDGSSPETIANSADTISVIIHGGLDSQEDIDQNDLQFAQEFRQALSRNAKVTCP